MDSTDRQTKTEVELPRKALHLFVAVIPLGMLWAGRALSIKILVPLALLAVAADFARSRRADVESFIQEWLGFMMRPSEAAVPGRLIINGATWVMISLAVLAVLFELRIAAPAFMMFIIGDAAAAIVGQRLGRHRWPGSHRTLEGSLAFVAAGVLLAWAYPGLPLFQALPALVAGAAAEVPNRPFNDNFRVPLVIAAVLLVLEIIT